MNVIDKAGKIIGRIEEVNGEVFLTSSDKKLQQQFVDIMYQKTKVDGITLKKKIPLTEVSKQIDSVGEFKCVT